MPIPAGYTSGQIVQAVPSLSAYAVTSSTRPATPFDGQIISETDTDTLQIYKGSAWGNPSGLVYITGASFSAAASVSFATDTFTSTYENYRVMLNISSGSANGNVRFRMRAAGSDNTTANYYVGGLQVTYGGTQNVASSSADTAGYLLGQLTTVGNQVAMDIFSPKATANTQVMGLAVGGSGASGSGGFFGNAFLATTSFDSMTIYPTSGTFTGSYKVYGYSNS